MKTVIALLALLAGGTTWGQIPAVTPTAGGATSFEVTLESGYLAGYSQYKISGSDSVWGSWESRLEWPLDCLLTGGKAVLVCSGGKYVATVSFLTNLTDDPGELRDYDWVAGEKTSKGVVDTSLEAHILDLNLYWNMVRKPRFTLGLGLGYTWQHFSWDGDSELTQTEYDSAYNRAGGITPGTYHYPRELWITYRIDYHMPYLGVRAAARPSELVELTGEGRLLLVIAHDRDDHVQRQKLSKTDYAGAGVEIEATVILHPTEWCRLGAFLQGSLLTAEGDQDQDFYDGSGLRFSGIEAEAKSLQGYAGLEAGVTF